MSRRDEVAIVGYAARVPGAANIDAFWSLLRDNRSSVSWITPDRFATKPYLHPAPDQIGRSYTFAAGIIDDVWGFDASAFGMSPREAEQLDPQHRHLLEVSYDALAHACIRPSSLAGSDAGVYIGASSVDHAARFIADPSSADVHMMTGNSLSIMANRISYTLDLRGPSLAIDTACSSSLVALNLAAEAIRSGAIDTAIVGGVNMLLSPFSYIGFSRASMLSPTGRCRPFDAAADGYVRSEGAIVVVLRSMTAARKARNRIHAVIVGSGMNQDGRTTGLSLPSPESQRRLLEQVYGDFSVDPADLTFVEAHGTGTRVGDPIEADALGKGLAQRRSQPLPIGSVKSNIGHLEPVSGLAGVLKSVMALKHGVVPATLHQQAPSPDIPFDELNLKVIDRNWRPLERRGPSLAGVNSFGFGGTNAHAILRSDDAVVTVLHSRHDKRPPPLLISAHSGDALRSLAASYDRYWPTDKRLAHEFIGASAHQRDHLPHRAIIRGESAEEIRHRIDLLARSENSPHIQTGHSLGNNLPVAFVFSGNGSQWAGMGRDVWHANPRFREALTEVDGHFAKVQDWSIVDQLFAEDLAPKLRRATYSQPLLLALQIATVRALEDSGVTPSATLGHSVGEIAAAWAAGALSLEQAIDVVIARSRHQESVRGSGAMAAFMLSDREAQRFLKMSGAGGVAVAAVNSWRSVTVSGPSEEIDRVLQAAATMRISARRLDLDYPFHSALVEPVRAPLLSDLEGLKPLALRKRFVSSVTGDFAEAEGLVAEHWWRNVREPVQFESAFKCLVKEGLRLFMEIGPKPILASYVRDVLRESSVRGAVIETLVESEVQQANDLIENAASKVVIAGGKVDLSRVFGRPPATAVELPLYPWQHAQFVVPLTVESSTIFQDAAHPLLGRRLRLDATEWFSTIDTALYPWIADHKVAGVPVFPAVAFIDVVLAAARELYPESALELRDFDIVRPLVFDSHTSFETMVRVSRETGLTEFLSRARTTGSHWSLHARGIIGRSPIASRPEVDVIAPAGTVAVAQRAVYRAASKLGFDYGPSFQRAHSVAFPHPKRAIVTLGPAAEPKGDQHVVDLTGIDSAFHALFASEEAGVADMPMKRMLPVRFGTVRSFSPGTVADYAVARTIRQSPTSMLVNLELVDKQGKVLHACDGIRLVEAPAELAVDPRSIGYRITQWRRDRPHVPSGIVLPAVASAISGDSSQPSPATLAEALLLLEAGCLKASWTIFDRARNVTEAAEETVAGGDKPLDWQPFLRSALLWHLESRGLVSEGDGTQALAVECDLPEVSSIVRSLSVRHPTMATEAAALSRIEEFLGDVIKHGSSASAKFSATPWRHLENASNQISVLREEVGAAVKAALEQCDPDRLLLLLMVGADHCALAADLVATFLNVELILTDHDNDRLEQARATLGDDAPQIRCLPWAELDGLPGGAVDLAFSIDALGEIAAQAGGLERLVRPLRSGAPIIAGELAPSLFWDIVRGVKPTWWARSTNADFPVGALLTGQEWIDEFQTAGITAAMADPVKAEPRIGVVIRGLASRSAAAQGQREWPSFQWIDDDASTAGELQAELGPRLAKAMGPRVAGAEAPATGEAPKTTDAVWVIAQAALASDPGADLAANLATIVARCRHMGDGPARLWVLVDFGDADADVPPLERPQWCALASAMRVVQNEYYGVQIRCLGLAGAVRGRLLDQVAEELLSPSDERELFFEPGRRLVYRVKHGVLATAMPAAPPADTLLRLENSQGGSRGSLAWVSGNRSEPGAQHVEIKVAATGLNFRDVMWSLRLLPEEALEDGYAGANLGMECSGVVTRVGSEVEGIKVGDHVIAFASGAFASHVVVPAFAVNVLPQSMSLESATTVPVAFLTAYYSLVHLAQLRCGETVLVHGGAGAVGLAAMQIARHLGARVIATAGSDEKRALLRNFGADLVCNSRILTFVDEITTFTNGTGVNVVLNSLAGEAMVRSMDCLARFGRFVELGKRDFYSNTHLGLRPLRRNITYFGVDVDQLIGDYKELTQRLFGEILGLFAEGALVPLPYRTFTGGHVGEAFRLMQRSGHIGKIVITPASHETASHQSAGKFPVSSEGSHVVIGGTSGFGLATAEWLVGRGATSLRLISRSGNLSEEAAAKIEALRQGGVHVDVAAVDVADADALEQYLRKAGQDRAIKGIVHAAMVLDDRLIDGQDRESIDVVLRPKVAGAENLERLAPRLNLDYLLFFSSATTLFGNPGQFNYVAANAYIEGLARRMRAQGLPALAIAWGGIEDAGYLSRHIDADPNLKRRFAASLIAARTALDGLDWAFGQDGRQATAAAAIARIDWAAAKRELAATRTPLFGAVGTRISSRQAMDAAATLEKLRALPPDEAASALVDIVVEEIARVLRLPPKEVDRHRPLADIGMDSLMMLELRTTVETTLQVELPMMSLATGITPVDVAHRILPLITGEGQRHNVPGTLVALSASHFAAEAETSVEPEQRAAVSAVLERVRELEGPL
jgi:acyl transferase domain-containing protein/NADPH:quinone reductase-like Zn-dependent oxidoreductase/acyl carrier protein